MGTAVATIERHGREKVALTLYELTEEQLALDDLIGMQDGEVDDAAEQLYEYLALKMATKADDFGRYLRTREAIAASISEEEKRLAARRKALENHIERLKRYAVMALRHMDRPKVQGDTFTLAIQKNPASIKVNVGAEELPEEYVRVIPAKIEADRTALLTALKAGKQIAGVDLVDDTYHLRVR
jgi:hypothetical protein